MGKVRSAVSERAFQSVELIFEDQLERVGRFLDDQEVRRYRRRRRRNRPALDDLHLIQWMGSKGVHATGPKRATLSELDGEQQ